MFFILISKSPAIGLSDTNTALSIRRLYSRHTLHDIHRIEIYKGLTLTSHRYDSIRILTGNSVVLSVNCTTEEMGWTMSKGAFGYLIQDELSSKPFRD